MPSRNLWLILTTMVLSIACLIQARRARWMKEIGFAMELVHGLYYETKDRDDLYRAAMNGIVSDLDPYSTFISDDQFVQFESLMKQEFGGLGVLIDGPPEYEQLTIVMPLLGTPASRAGLEPGDIITAIDGESTLGQNIEQSSRKLKGPEGTLVHLTVRRQGVDHELEFDIQRAAIELESVVGDRRNRESRWVFTLEDHPDIGYIRVTTFGEKTPAELRSALQQIPWTAKGLVIDLRDNGGGLLTAATEICDMFLEEGLIVSTKGRDGLYDRETLATAGTDFPFEIPMVILLSRQSASASEVVAACLQDRGRAVVAGERSYGKGSVQNVIEMFGIEGAKSAIKLTTARYFPPSGRNIHRGKDMTPEDAWGVLPLSNLSLELNDDYRLSLYKRWRQRSDPRNTRSTSADEANDGSAGDTSLPTEALPDAQLDMVVDYLLHSPTASQDQDTQIGS